MHKHNNKAFTILELAVVIACLGILIVLSIISYSGWRTRLAEAQIKNDLLQMASAMENARNFGTGYPASLPTTFQVTSGSSLSLAYSNTDNYCIDGTVSAFSVSYFIRSNYNPTQPEIGSCIGNYVTSGLLMYLDAGSFSSYSGTGTTWTDLSGNNRNFTLVNSPTYSSANGGAFTFNGTTQYATIPFSTSPFRQTSAITYDFWMNRPSASSVNVMGTTASGGSGTGGIASLAGLIEFNYTPTNPNSDTNIQASSSVGIGQWAHYSFTFNFATGAYQWYINGNPVTTTINRTVTNFVPNTSYNVASGSDLIGGRTTNGSISYFSGSLSLVRVYNRALSASEVLQNFNAARYRYGL